MNQSGVNKLYLKRCFKLSPSGFHFNLKLPLFLQHPGNSTLFRPTGGGGVRVTSRKRSPLIGGELGEESRKLGQKSEPNCGEEEQIPGQRSTKTATVTRTGPLDANWTEPSHTVTARLILDSPETRRFSPWSCGSWPEPC